MHYSSQIYIRKVSILIRASSPSAKLSAGYVRSKASKPFYLKPQTPNLPITHWSPIDL